LVSFTHERSDGKKSVGKPIKPCPFPVHRALASARTSRAGDWLRTSGDQHKHRPLSTERRPDFHGCRSGPSLVLGCDEHPAEPGAVSCCVEVLEEINQ
jgi:hypothetical protein